MDCLDKEEDLVPIDKEAQKELFRQIRSNYINLGNNNNNYMAKENNSKHSHGHDQGTKITKNHQAHEHHKIQANLNREKDSSEGNSNLPRSLLPDDFKPLTRENFDKEKEQV